ncbi:hypothetical protein BH23ACT10_BH23ACT10_27090 [soil metagenome]
MVHSRQIDGTEVVFGNEGALFGNAMTWWDHDTGSVWSQPLAAPILGPRAGSDVKLELLPSELTAWASWFAAHPETVALDADGGPTGFDLADMTLVVELGEHSAAFPVVAARTEGVINDQVGDEPVAIAFDPADPQRWRVYSRRVGDGAVRLELASAQLRDPVSDTRWDLLTGRGLEGPLAADALRPLPAFTSFPDDYRNFFPGGRIWPETATTSP